MKSTLATLVVLSYVSIAQAFPHESRVSTQPNMGVEERSQYDFQGTVSLSSCSGSLVRFHDAEDTDQGLILTNGHCVKLIEPGVVLTDLTSSRNFSILSATGQKLGDVYARRLLYATMTKTDAALYELRESYQVIRERFGIEALTLANEEPVVGIELEVISGYWKRGYSCEVERVTPELREGKWVFQDALRYSRPGCQVIGGTSGSPVLLKGSRTVIAVNNSINESGKACTLNNPCEVDETGQVTYQKGFGYAQQTFWFYTCRDSQGVFDLNVAGCLLPKP